MPSAPGAISGSPSRMALTKFCIRIACAVGRVVEGDLDVPDLGLGEAELGGLAELDHVGLVAREGELVVLEHQLAARADDLEAVGAGRLAGGGDEHAGGAVRRIPGRR